MDFYKSYKKYHERFEDFLNARLAKMRQSTPSAELFSAMEYALHGGGKRLRPVMFLAVYDFLTSQKQITDLDKAATYNLLDNLTDKSEPDNSVSATVSTTISATVSPASADNAEEGTMEKISCAIEMLHTYTLIHDDLPCLDNDDYRRGKPSCHKVFGEATALLAGDALLNHSFTLLLETAMQKAAQNTALVCAMHEFSVLTGYSGVIGGQSDEIDALKNANKSNGAKGTAANKTDKAETESVSESGKTDKSKTVSKERFVNIYKNKTAALFVGAALLAAALAGREDLTALIKDYAESFGLAFQLKDDLADNNKESFMYFFGEEETQRICNFYAEKARQAASSIGCDFLLKLVDFENYLQ